MKNLYLIFFFSLLILSCEKDYSSMNGDWTVSKYVFSGDTIAIIEPVFKLKLDTSNHFSYNGPDFFKSEGEYEIKENMLHLTDYINKNNMMFHIIGLSPNELILRMNKNGTDQVVYFNK